MYRRKLFAKLSFISDGVVYIQEGIHFRGFIYSMFSAYLIHFIRLDKQIVPDLFRKSC